MPLLPAWTTLMLFTPTVTGMAKGYPENGWSQTSKRDRDKLNDTARPA
jgi:hypothetical protein